LIANEVENVMNKGLMNGDAYFGSFFHNGDDEVSDLLLVDEEVLASLQSPENRTASQIEVSH
jgi:hypothetical protein